MTKIRFMEDLKIDAEHTLSQLLPKFGNVKHGLPELIKNSKDQYSALGISNTDMRVILVLASPKKKKLAVIDFAGARKEDFDRWATWSRRADDRREKAEDIEAGHGNGGKGFMVYGAESTSFFQSVTDGFITKMGFSAEDPDHNFHPGYFIEDGKELDNVPVESPRQRLEEAIAEFGFEFEDLPDEAQLVFEERQNFTIVQINDVKSWSNRAKSTVRRMVAELPRNLAQHAQAALTLESCRVWVLVDGTVVSEEPLSTKNPEPLEGFSELDPIPVPDELEDPETGEIVQTGPGDENTKYLQLRTSQGHLRTTDRKPLNVIRIKNDRNVVANWSVADLYSKAESAFILGELRVPAVKDEHVSGAEWNTLSDTPLVNALKDWTAQQVEGLAEKIQGRRATEHKAEEVDTANQGLEELRQLMRDFLEEDSDRGTLGGGPGDLGDDEDDGDDPPPPPPPPKYGDRVDEITLEGRIGTIAIGKDTAVPLVVKAYEIREDGERVRVKDPDLEFRTNDPEGIAFEREQVLGLSEGVYQVWFECKETEATSNKLNVEVVDCSDAEIKEAPDRVLLQGERVRLRPVFETSDGLRNDLLVEATVDEPGMGRVNRHCVFTAGTEEGVATVRVRYGGRRGETTTVNLRIGEERVSRDGSGGQEGGEIPLILLCGTEVPGMDDYPKDMRTVSPGEHQPTIIDYEPEFENVIFVNPDSKESIQVRKGRGGRKGVMGIGTATYLQFLALKCFEILKRLWVRQEVEGSITEVQFRSQFARAETECAPFIEKAYDLAKDLTSEAED